ncbi:bacterial sensory transduction regulator family protein [Corynebacterium simulans]|uniref:hypothetical protein n=1 Tax=Corynebacterium simulans TaxID=146827 RepID=UPI000785C848|nr:hypothetical protein [Corynebacterium simulans]AMO87940.1 bacterial sensory transduction regulator family protein [Corynebacterium simulans]
MTNQSISEVNIHRLAELFEQLEADYVLLDKIEDPAREDAAADGGEGLVLQTGLPHITIHFDIEDDTLSAFAVWEGRLPASAEDKVGAFIAEFNWNMSAPTLSYDFRPKGTGAGAKQEEEEIAICANRAMGVGIGLSSNQLGSFVLSAFDSFGMAFDAVAEAFPQAAKWNDKAANKKGRS